MIGPHTSGGKAEAMRLAFDHSFALPPSSGRGADREFLAVHIAGEPYALELSEIASLHVDRAWLATPSLLPELLGLASFRGVLAPVYDLAAVLGGAPHPNARWLVLVRAAAPIAFAFETFDAQLRVTLDLVSAPGGGTRASDRGAVRSGAHTLPILNLPSLIDGISRRITALRPVQER